MTAPQHSRRAVLAAFGGAAAAACCADHLLAASTAAPTSHGVTAPRATSLDLVADAVTVADGLAIIPRRMWGADLPPTRPLVPEDVRFLLVHHSATSNNVPDPRSLIRNVYAFHTSSQKGWGDVAYNFFVAPDGSAWEGRAGSLAGPVRGDATGGNQGFSQLVCLLGNHVSTPPTPAAQQTLVRLLAWLAGRSGLAVHDGASASFVSQGANRFAAGRTVTTSTISAHRDVTFTACPGDAAVALLPLWRRQVYDIVSATWQTDGLQRASRTSLRPPQV